MGKLTLIVALSFAVIMVDSSVPAFRRIKDYGFFNKKFDGFNDEIADKYMDDASKDEVYMDDDGSCVDKNNNCDTYAKKNKYCVGTNAEYMRQNCCNSCHGVIMSKAFLGDDYACMVDYECFAKLRFKKNRQWFYSHWKQLLDGYCKTDDFNTPTLCSDLKNALRKKGYNV